MEKCIAGCGIEIRAEDGWVCPYFCRRDDWDNTLLHKGYGPCQIDLQVGTNVCLYAPDDFLMGE